MTTEFPRPISISKIPPKGFTTTVRATPEECATVAARMDIPAIQSLECFFTLVVQPDGVTISAQGRLRARVTRTCVASAEEFETSVEDEFAVQFVLAGTERDSADPEFPDEIPYDEGTIDLGETTAEQLGLALDPYPRMPNALVPDVENDHDTSSFFLLAGLLGPNRNRQ